MTNTQANIGIRRMIRTLATPQWRNFEANIAPTTLYNAYREPLEFLGTKYHVGDALPFDVASTSYSKAAVQLLELYWNAGWCVPAV